MITLAIAVVIVLMIFWLIGVYNYLVRLKNQVQNSWAQISIQLQRRYDLIPNLVETVKGYMNYEKSTLEAVIQARSEAISAKDKLEQRGGPTGTGSIKELLAAEGTLKSALGHFFALAENYPQLKASEPMRGLQEELSTTENKIAFARQAYNDQVMNYNIAQQSFPSNLFSSILGFHPAELYDVENSEAKKSVKVSFE
ncbi:Protein LemA [Chlamydiales bacterium STE3]|nr:Protein LemA [Chlamydiales bacterium STE3]